MKAKSGSAGIPKHIPAKQRLAMEQKLKLKRLVKEFPYVSLHFEDDDLKSNANDLFKNIGFVSDHIDVKKKNEMIKRLLYGLEKNHLILIHYQRKLDGYNILGVFNELKRHKPHKSFKNLVPVFIANVASGKDYLIFKALSKFDIRFAVFLSPNSSGDAKMEKLLNELQVFQELIFDEIKLQSAQKPDVSLANKKKSEIIEKYKSLLKQAEELMDSDPEKSIELFTEAIELKPVFGALVQRGDAYYLISEFMSAINDYRKANKLSRDRADPFAKISACCFNLVSQEAEKGDKDKARKWFDRGVKSFHKAEEIIKEIEQDDELFVEGAPKRTYKILVGALAEADFRDIGMDEEERKINSLSAKVFKKIEPVDFSNEDVDVDGRIDYAILLTRQRDYEAAERIFRAIISQNADNTGPAFNNFAIELRKNKEYQKAFEIYMELLKYKIPDKRIVVQNMMMAGRKYAQAARDSGESAKAVKIYQGIIKYANNAQNMEWVFCDMAVACLEISNPDQALVFFNRAINLNENLTESEQFESYRPLRGFANAR